MSHKQSFTKFLDELENTIAHEIVSQTPEYSKAGLGLDCLLVLAAASPETRHGRGHDPVLDAGRYHYDRASLF